MGVSPQLLAQASPSPQVGTSGSSAPGSSANSPPPPAVAKTLQDIIVSPENPLVEEGQRQVFAAQAVYSDGSTEDVTNKVAWETDPNKVANFIGASVCEAAAAGTTRVYALDNAGKLSGMTRLTVAAPGKAPVLKKVTISPLNPDIKDEPVQFKAMGLFSDKSTHEITLLVTWESGNDKVVSIDKRGLATPGLEEGHPIIRGMDPNTGLSESTTVYVTPSGVQRITVSPKTLSIPSGDDADITLTASMYSGATRPLNRLVQWTSSEPNVADMTAGGTKVEGKSPGDATIEAFEPNSKTSDTFDVKVLPAVLTAIWLTPTDKPIPSEHKLKFDATGVFSDSTTIILSRLKWSAVPPDLVDLNQDGEAQAKKTGIVTITAEDPITHVTGSIELKAQGPP